MDREVIEPREPHLEEAGGWAILIVQIFDRHRLYILRDEPGGRRIAGDPGCRDEPPVWLE